MITYLNNENPVDPKKHYQVIFSYGGYAPQQAPEIYDTLQHAKEGLIKKLKHFAEETTLSPELHQPIIDCVNFLESHPAQPCKVQIEYYKFWILEITL